MKLQFTDTRKISVKARLNYDKKKEARMNLTSLF